MTEQVDLLKVAALQDQLQQRSFASFGEYMRHFRRELPDETMLWRRCAFPLSFDRNLFQSVLRKGLAEGTTDFEQAISTPGVEPLPRAEGFYRLQDTSRVERLGEWLKAEPDLTGLRALAEAMLAHFGVSAPEFEKLRCLVATRPQEALSQLQTLFREADERFDMARCQTLVNLLSELDILQSGSQQAPLKLLTPELRAFCDDKLQYIQRRQFFTEEYYRTIRYHQRESLLASFQAFLSNQSGRWVFHVYATGGMGKTMFLRWLVAHHCVPSAVPVARVDFDFIRVPILLDAPWLILLPIAEQLNVQILGRPFEEYLSELREFGPLLQLPSALPPGTDVSGLEITIRSRSKSWRQQWAERFATKFAGSAIILLDTLEEAVLHHPDVLSNVLIMLRQVHRGMRGLRAVLSGRYWLGERNRLPYFTEVLARETDSVEIKPFTDSESTSYLTVRRELSDTAYPIPNLIRKAGGIPMRLSLLADIALQHDSLTPEEVDKFEPEFEYLIRRIVNRIPDRDGDVRWLIRYGVIPRRLTRSFIAEVLYSHLERERKRDSETSQDRVASYSDSWKSYELRGIEQLWSRLGDYASLYGWLRPTATELRFEPEVIQPMRKLLSQEPIFQAIHRDAARWFEQRAVDDPANWGAWIAEAIYHRFQLDGPNAAPFWRECMKNPRAQESRTLLRSLISVVIGPDFLDDEGTPYVHFNRWAPVDDATLAEASFRDASSASWQQMEVPDMEEDWNRVRERLRRARLHQGRAHRQLFSHESAAVVECCIDIGERKYKEAAAHAVAALAEAKSPSIRFMLAMQLGTASEGLGKSSDAVRYFQNASDLAEKHRITFPRHVLRQKFGRAHARLRQFYEAEAQFLEAVKAADAVGEVDIGAAITLELAEVYSDGWRFQQALDALSSRQPSEELPKSPHFARQRLRALCLIHQWRLLEAFQVVDAMAEVSSLLPLQRAQFLELKGTLDSAMFDNSAADALEEAISDYSVLGEQQASSRTRSRRIRHALECEGNCRDAARLIENATESSGLPHQLENAVHLLQLAHLRGTLAEEKGNWNEFLKQVNLLDPRLVATACVTSLAFATVDDEGEVAKRLENALGRIRPPEERFPFLRPFRYRSVPLSIPRRLARRLLGLIEMVEPPHADFPAQALAALDFIRVLKGEDQAKRLAERLMAMCSEDSPVIALRELLAACDRLGLHPPRHSLVAAFARRVGAHGLTAVTVIEDSLRRINGRTEGDVEHSSAAIDQAAQRSIRGTQWEALSWVLAVRFGRVSVIEGVKEARRIHEQLGLPPSPLLLELEERPIRNEGAVTSDGRKVQPPVSIAAHQVLPPVSDFAGRVEEIEAIEEALHGGNRVGVSGMAGIGKTELARKLAERLQVDYPDAQLWVDLRGSDATPLPVTEALASCIRSFVGVGVQLPTEQSLLRKMYLTCLEGRRALVVLDNAHDEAQVELLVPPAGCANLLTSPRSLELPGLTWVNLDRLSPQEALNLLPRVPDSVAREVAALCGYVPLALRSAANQLEMAPNAMGYLHRVAAEIERRKDMQDDSVDVFFRLSYVDLARKSAGVFRLLAVFPGSFDAKAEEVICEDAEHEALRDLVRRGLVTVDQENRYRLHEAVRDFADGLLAEKDRESGRSRHSTVFAVVTLVANELCSRGGEYALQGLHLFDLERENIRSGQSWAAARSDEQDTAAHLCSRYADGDLHCQRLRLNPTEVNRWLELARRAARRLNMRDAECRHLANLGRSYELLGETRKAISFYKEALVIAREIGERQREVSVLANLGRSHESLGERSAAIEFYEKALVIAREIGERHGEAFVLANLGRSYQMSGETRRAIGLYEEALVIAHKIGERQREVSLLANLGGSYESLGESRSAIEFYEKALVVAHEIGERHGEVFVLANLGRSYELLGETRKAITFYEHALVVAREIGDRETEDRILAMVKQAKAALEGTDQASTSGGQILVITPKVDSVSNLTGGDELVSKEIVRALAKDPAELGHYLATLLPIPSLDQRARVAVLLESSAVGALPWELAFPRDRVCFRASAERPAGRAVADRKGPLRVLVLERSSRTEEMSQRGFHGSRVDLTAMYRQFGRVERAESLHDPAPRAVAEGLALHHPAILHVRAGFRYSTSAGLQLDFASLYADTKSSFEQTHFTSSVFARMLKEVSGSQLLIVLDPPLPPDHLEAALQVLYRNAFASEVFRLASCDILAIGLAAPGMADEVASRFVEQISARRTLAQLLQLFRENLSGHLFATHAAALFTPQPDTLVE